MKRKEKEKMKNKGFLENELKGVNENFENTQSNNSDLDSIISINFSRQASSASS